MGRSEDDASGDPSLAHKRAHLLMRNWIGDRLRTNADLKVGNYTALADLKVGNYIALADLMVGNYIAFVSLCSELLFGARGVPRAWRRGLSDFP